MSEWDIRSSDETLIAAMRILANDVMSEDGVANMAIAEAADRIESLSKRVSELEPMRKIGEMIISQDNRCTDAPIFIVQEKKRIYGMDLNFTDDYAWIDTANDHCEASEEESERLDELDDDGSLGDWEKFGYIDIWEFVTACFTEQGCKDYLEINGHNLKEPRIYADGSFRNKEFRAVRDYLISIGKENAKADN